MNTAIRITILPPAEALEEDQKLYDIWQGAQQRGFSIEFAAKRVPVLVAPCYVELIVEGLKVAGEGIIGGLAYDIAKALARSIKIQFDGWIVGLREGKAFSQIEVKRGNEEEAVRLISEALAEMYEQMNQEE